MPSPKNLVILACAGARKTTEIVETAIAAASQRVLVLTYTNENSAQIDFYLASKCGCVPANVTSRTWFTWLLQDCIRPYQPSLIGNRHVEGYYFDSVPQSASRVKRANAARYYLSPNNLIYRDRASSFVLDANIRSRGAVISRLERLYDLILIDEIQDLAGHDLDILDLLFASRADLVAMGDIRQATFATNNASRNSQYRRQQILSWFTQRENRGVLSISTRNKCFRSNQAICDFADRLFPDLPSTQSAMSETTDHDGIFEIPRQDVLAYYDRHTPVVLRYDRRADTLGLPAQNFGGCKGKTFDRVLIFPTGPMREYLRRGHPHEVASVEKFYVAVTRARFSVAFVID